MDATHLAISDGTDFDERQINHNFDYDSEAYGEVVAWCKAMLQSDCVGFICDDELRTLQKRAESSRTK